MFRALVDAGEQIASLIGKSSFHDIVNSLDGKFICEFPTPSVDGVWLQCFLAELTPLILASLRIGLRSSRA